MRLACLRDADGVRNFFSIDDDATARKLSRPPWEGIDVAGEPRPWDPADLAAPVCPTKVVCIGRNYAAHARELGNDVPSEPLLFLKPPSSIIGPRERVLLPPQSSRVEHEAELGVVISRRATDVSREDALSYVLGYTVVCDVTARDLQRKDVQFTRGKGFDTFCPVGPWIETELDPSRVRVRCSVNGEVRQDGTTEHMIFDVPTLIAAITSVMTLEPGDLIATGTPEGVGPLVDGDSVEVSVEGIGALPFSVALRRPG
ncbi:MAG: fumarylacetoacetate hydrolase family protein [Myxococcales bacterium]|nr:fumarylacetoacetate hydrolase family protein [Myxococcales bacterium]